MALDELAKSHVIVVDPPAGSTTQPTADDPNLGTPDEAIEPPLPLEQLAIWSQINGTRSECIDAIARNSVGLGWTLEVEPGHELETGDPRERVADATARLEALAGRDSRLERPSLTELLYAVKTDEEEVGWGFIEVSRSKLDGRIDGLFHVPGKRMRRLNSRDGYVLLGANGALDDKTFFVPFGEKIEYGPDGLPTARLAPGHPAGWLRNEVICMKLYSSQSRDYGAPRDVALTLEHLADKLANEANAAYFDNGGALPTILFVQGDVERSGSTISVTVPHEVTQRIASVLKSKTGVGPTGTGRVAVIPLPAGVKAQKEVLGQMSEKDIGHVAFRADMRQRTISAFRISPIFLGLSGDAQYDAEVERAISEEQIFKPERKRYNDRLGLVLRDIGFPELAMKLNELAVENDATKRSSAEKMSETGTITRRDYRKAHGYAPMPEAKEGVEPLPGEQPFGWNDEIIEVGRPDGAQNRVVEGDGQQGERPGLGGRGSRDRGQAASAADPSRVDAQVRRLTGRTATGGARRALERARSLPED